MPCAAFAEKGATSMKGWELRSWHDPQGACIPQVHSGIDPAWCYSLLVGTNREKTRDEVVKEPLSEAKLVQKLAELKSGEEISWVTDGKELQLPPKAPLGRIEKEAKRLGLKLQTR
jgi:hypothetical protein